VRDARSKRSPGAPEVPFAYFDNLTERQKRTYRKSDRILRIEWPDMAALVPLAKAVEPVLEDADRARVETACQSLVDAMNAQLETPPVEVHVLERRPSNDAGELQGLYEPDEVTGGVARITVWMRTARKEQVVKFRTFLRTLVHELCHHLDYEYYELPETFHTQGFYTRESVLMRELLGEQPQRVRGGD
jgi:hypothetical protein